MGTRVALATVAMAGRHTILRGGHIAKPVHQEITAEQKQEAHTDRGDFPPGILLRLLGASFRQNEATP